MKKSEIKKEIEFNRFEKNLMKAEVLQRLGECLESNLEQAETELKDNALFLNDKYDELMNEHDEDEDISDWEIEWKLNNANREVQKSKIKIALWKKIVALIDKELG